MKKQIIVLLHTGYWLLYSLLVLLFLAALSEAQVSKLPHPVYSWLFHSPVGLLGYVPNVLSFYAFYLFLFPRFLQRKKIILLIAWALLTAVLSAGLGLFLLSLFFSRVNLFNEGWTSFLAILTLISCISVIHGIIALVMRGFISWYGDIRLKEELRNKNSEMEMALLKAQINPHFLFNTINNIDVLIQKDAAKASLYLNKLSDIMRFMLYETRSEQIPLEKELAYIEKYIELQKIRSANPNYVTYEVSGQPPLKVIAPMLFIPFIENAFKHSENKKRDNAIRIRLALSEQQAVFTCENSYSRLGQPKPEYGGLGNELIRRRLQLLYPGKHVLDISNNDDTYMVKLTVNLS